LNRRHKDFQSSALPTELPGPGTAESRDTTIYFSVECCSGFGFAGQEGRNLNAQRRERQEKKTPPQRGFLRM
jgi:hypothetical protein